MRVGLGLVVGIALALSGCSRVAYDPHAVQEDFVTLSNDAFTIFKGESDDRPGIGAVYSVSVYAPEKFAPASLRKLEDAVFAGYAGGLAELKDIPTVEVLHFADKAGYEAYAKAQFDNWWYRHQQRYFQDGAKEMGLDGTWVSRAVWPVWAWARGYRQHQQGPHGAVYKRGADGVWTRDGSHPGAPRHLREVTLATGARFALTGSFDRAKDHVLIYECISCKGDEDVDGVMDNFPAFMEEAVRPDAVKFARFKTVRVSIFAGQRKDLWHFPSSVDLKVDPNNHQSWSEGAKGIVPGLRQLWGTNLRGSRKPAFLQ